MQELSNVIAGKYEEIIEKIKSFSNEYLNEEYTNICLIAAETLCLNNEEQLKKGKSLSWAAGIVHAIGSINGLFDSKEEPYIKALDLYKSFGVSSSTGSSKSKEVKCLLELSEDNTRWIISRDKDAIDSREEIAATVENTAEIDEIIDASKEKPFKFEIDKKFVLAQRIVNYAWRQKNYKNRAKYAKEALDVYENCADAYIILAKDASLNDIQKKELLEKAVKAGKNALKIDSLETAKNEIFELRVSEPFFGAKYTLALQLWEMNEKDEAIKNAFEILKYNKKDHLMTRGVLANWLLIDERYEQLKELLEKYDNDYLAATNYSRVALLYKIGDLRSAENALRRAYKRNPFVIAYILKQKKAPNSLSFKMKFGTEEEAMQYASLGLEAWNDPKMLAWIKEMKKDFDILNFK